MAVPTFLNTSHRYLRVNGVTDVATIITNVESECVTNGSPAWTKPSAGLFKSPVDDDGRWFDVLLTSISATNLEMRVRDDRGVTVVTRRMYIDAGGTDVLIASGEMHLWIISLRAITETLRAGMLDLSPESQKAHLGYVYGAGSRDTSNNLNQYAYDQIALLAINTNSYNYQGYIESIYATSIAAATSITASGIYAFRPAFAHGYGSTGGNRQFGRIFQSFLGDSSLTPGTLYDVPIDSGVTAKFTPMGGIVGAATMLIRAD